MAFFTAANCEIGVGKVGVAKITTGQEAHIVWSRNNASGVMVNGIGEFLYTYPRGMAEGTSAYFTP